MNLFRVHVLIYIICFYGCTTSGVFDENKKIDNSLWDKDKPVVLQTIIDDTITPHNVYINIRNAGVYPFSNIFMFINTTLPHGELFRDTIEVMLQTPEGKWMGDGLGDIWDNRILFKSDVRFPQKGEYRFELFQAMRINPLPGIMDAGIRIEKAADKK
ncbi:MAG: gliding motility lipoprotein GldH [Bacteroidota bacterium]